MRISDWSSDVCSSDLGSMDRALFGQTGMQATCSSWRHVKAGQPWSGSMRRVASHGTVPSSNMDTGMNDQTGLTVARQWVMLRGIPRSPLKATTKELEDKLPHEGERKRVGEGKRGAGRGE